jgi:anhydro-N-acetylmuramic acid kinase
MNVELQKLYKIAQKNERNIIGLMSGTSLDGLDVALCQISGYGTETRVKLSKFKTVPYNADIRYKIRQVFAKQFIDFQYLCMLNAWIGRLHAEMILECLSEWNLTCSDVDLIASHGQTVFHAPKSLHPQSDFPNATLQIGDGDHIAQLTNIITVSDFRQKHIAAGGEGAPLAVYGDYLIFSKKDENRIMLNIGGIANFTNLPGSNLATEVFTTDTGPGNTLVDLFTRKFFPEKNYDKDAEISMSGVVNPSLLNELKKNDFFRQPFPKTTGPELFSEKYVLNAQQESNNLSISPPDLLATLTRFSAETIAEAISKACNANEAYHLYMSGGGLHNPLLIRYLHELLPDCIFHKTDETGILADAKEAVLFAVLANECIAGNSIDFGSRQGVPAVTMGKISLPSSLTPAP